MKKQKPKKGSISEACHQLVARRLSDDAIIAALRRKFRHLNLEQARAHVAGTRRDTGRKAPNVKTPNVVVKVA